MTPFKCKQVKSTVVMGFKTLAGTFFTTSVEKGVLSRHLRLSQIAHPGGEGAFATQSPPQTHESPGSHPGLPQNQYRPPPATFNDKRGADGVPKWVSQKHRPWQHDARASARLPPALLNPHSSFHLGSIVQIGQYTKDCLHKMFQLEHISEMFR
jgi:hypothetical protein